MYQTEASQLYFDTSEIDYKLSKGELCEIKIKRNENVINNKFKYLKNLTKEEINSKKDRFIEFPKYFAQICVDHFKYTGILSNFLNRDIYGYSLTENNDEYLGEYKTETKDGFGICKTNQRKGEIEIYIGNYINNIKAGEGMCLKIFSLEGTTLIDYDFIVGNFDIDRLRDGKIFSVKNGEETLYKGKVNNKSLPDDENALVFNKRNKIFCGKIEDGKMVEGRNIVLNDNLIKQKGYYFYSKKKNYNNYNIACKFDYLKFEEFDELLINKLKNYLNKEYKKKIQNIYNKIIDIIETFKDFNKAINVDFNKFKSEIQTDIEYFEVPKAGLINQLNIQCHYLTTNGTKEQLLEIKKDPLFLEMPLDLIQEIEKLIKEIK